MVNIDEDKLRMFRMYDADLYRRIENLAPENLIVETMKNVTDREWTAVATYIGDTVSVCITCLETPDPKSGLEFITSMAEVTYWKYILEGILETIDVIHERMQQQITQESN